MKLRDGMGPLIILAVSGWIVGACGGDSEVFGGGTGSGTTSSGTTTSSGSGGGTTSSGSGGGTTSSGSGGSTTSSGSGGGTTSSGSGGEGAGGSGVGDPCNWEVGDCGGGLYCDALGCADGTCQPILPVQSQANHIEPVCGCDGISYFNFSIAASFGMAVSHTDRCQGGEQLGCHPSDAPCPDGRFCSRQVDNGLQCLQPADVAGACWGLPEACNTSDPNMPEGRLCALGNPGCQDICTLMKSQEPWKPENICF